MIVFILTYALRTPISEPLRDSEYSIGPKEASRAGRKVSVRTMDTTVLMQMILPNLQDHVHVRVQHQVHDQGQHR